jgi:hypothetical protein
MVKRVLTVFILVQAVAVTAPLAADRTSFGLGLGALYNGLGVNIAFTDSEDLKFVAVGCSSWGHSSRDGTDVTCGVGVGWIMSDILTKKNDKHGIGLHFGLNYDTRHNDFEPVLSMPYVFFFKGIDSKGLNIGAAPLVAWESGDAKFGLFLQIGYQF